jgi:hypothetical protein
MTDTISVAGVAVPVRDNTVVIQDALAQRSTCNFTVLDPTGTTSIVDYSQVSVVDSVSGPLFTGFVFDATETNLYPNAQNDIAVTCMDNKYLADKHYFGVKANGQQDKEKINQYAGNIAVELLHDYLAQEGITAAYAIRKDTTDTDFNAGTLSNVAGTLNVDDGDLELALAGSPVTIVESTTSDFAAGTLTNVVAASNTLSPVSTTALKIVGTCSQPGSVNAYSYIKIWSGSQAVATNDVFNYDIWIDPASPTGQIGVDIVFSDGTTWHDTATKFDAQNQPPYPNTDLAGLATGQWYHRAFNMDQYNLKFISFVTIACEGDKVGTYTGWIKNILLASGTTHYFFQNTLNVNPPQQMQNNGYSSTLISVVTTYNLLTLSTSFLANRVSSASSLSGVNLLKSSYVTWIADEPIGTKFVFQYSLDGGQSYISCIKNAPLPALPAGLSMVGTSIQFREAFSPDTTATTKANPEQAPTLHSVQIAFAPSYHAVKSDILFSTASGNWAANGTLSNTAVPNGIDLSLNGAVDTFDSGTISETTYGTGSPVTSINNRRLSLKCNASGEMRASMDLAPQLANGTVEVDVLVDNASNTVGLVYRTTYWGNADHTFAYVVQVNPTNITLSRGSNSSSPSLTGLGSATLAITSGNWHRIKVVFSGSTHQIYLDDILYITVTDGTFTAAGYVGLRLYNGSGSAYAALFDNFGIQAALTGTWISNNQSLTAAGTYGDSMITWRDVSSDPGNTDSILVETQVDGSTYQVATNGAAIPNLTFGQSLVGVNLKVRITLTTSTASTLPAIDQLTARVLGQFNASGSRISPVLSLSPVGRVGNSLVAWNVALPSGCTLGVDTSPDGVTWTDVSGSSGGAIPGYFMQPDPTVDPFAVNSSANYTATSAAGGTVGTITWDTASSRLRMIGGINTLLLTIGLTAKDVDLQCTIRDADLSGLVWRVLDTSNFYLLTVSDASSSGSAPNTLQLYKVQGGVFTLLVSTSIVFLRNTYHTIRVTMLGGGITAYFDGQAILTFTDGFSYGSGGVGLYNTINTGTGIFYSFRVQPLGDDLTGKNVYTRLRLASTNPTATPQVLDLTVSAHDPDIGVGALIPTTAYSFYNGNITTISACFDDLCAKSQLPAPFTWTIDKNKKCKMKAKTGTPAPFPVATANGDYLVANLQLYNNSPAYRNDQYIIGGTDTAIQVETRLGDSVSQTWTMGFPLATPTPPNTPLTVTIDGIAQTIGIRGTDTGRAFYYQIGSTQITQDASLIPPAAQEEDGTPAQVIVFTYLGQIPVVSHDDDDTEQAALATLERGSGIVTMVENFPGLNKAASDAMCAARLAQYKVRGQTFTYDTLRSGIEVGMVISAFCPEHRLNNTQCLVSSVKTTLKNVSTATQPSGIQPWYEIVLITGNLLLDYTRFLAKVLPNQ